MPYSHTQRAPLHYLLLVIAAGLMAYAAFAPTQPVEAILLGGLAGVFLLMDFSFQHLRVEDEGDRLRICFGPLPVFQRSVRYEDITRAEAARSSLIDGWGIHWVPGRGWTWNLWGFDCVEVTHNGKLLRIGTDDPQGLAEFLQGRVAGGSR